MNIDQIKATIAVLDILYSSIQEAGTQGVPSGHLYAMLMGKLSLNQYEQLISVLVKSGKVTNQHHLLRCV